ncbi:MAG TPA: dipeptidase PepE [Ohtaekwangia sp.]|nr:dipeptidase PepE [Ohtaekwangia sp.]
MHNLLLLSNSTIPGTTFFSWPRPLVKEMLGEKPKNLVFIPYAAVNFAMDEYEDIVRQAFNEMNYSIFSIHRVSNKLKAIESADGIVVGGGNTFALLSRVYADNLMELIGLKVEAGTPYVGWSAGANLACPTIKTTNDMPIIQPPSLNALGFIPFQINAHYHELKFENQGGETRKERLQEFLIMNPTVKVVGLPEGMALRREDGKLTLLGDGTAKLYQAEKAVLELPTTSDLSYLLQ